MRTIRDLDWADSGSGRKVAGLHIRSRIVSGPSVIGQSIRIRLAAPRIGRLGEELNGRIEIPGEAVDRTESRRGSFCLCDSSPAVVEMPARVDGAGYPVLNMSWTACSAKV